MKEFDKQWQKIAEQMHDAPMFWCDAGWKAALEWIAKRGMYHYGNDFLTDMNELSTEIQIELGMLDEHGKVIR